MAERGSIWLTRPEADSTLVAKRLAPHTCIIAPVMQIEMDTIIWPNTTPDALLLTSRHGAAALATAPHAWRTLPVYCVGNATAQAAGKSGFKNIHVGNGEVFGLLPQLRALTSGTRLLYLCGVDQRHDISALLRDSEISVTVLQVYTAKTATTLSANIRKSIASGDVGAAVFFSPRSATIACQLLMKAGLNDMVKTVDAYCISQATAEAAGALAWRSVQSCPVPTQEAMVELIVSHHHAAVL